MNNDASHPIDLKRILAPGITALRRYWAPFVLLQSCALGLVIGYYKVPAIHSFCQQISELKQACGFGFSMLAAAFAGAILPELAKTIMLRHWKFDRHRRNELLFAIVIFGINGLMIDAQFRVFAHLIGNDQSIRTITIKTLVDQFITTPIYGTTYWAVVYTLKHNRFDVKRTLREISPRWYLERVVPVLIPAWAYWLPMVILVYALPLPLQYPLGAVALGAWSLIMVYIANREPLVTTTPESPAALPASEPNIVE